ncbi:Flp family type IVb pilin [uncultured Trichococcus sp.]|uniref:Flp family type IVb pilin n=1 Tax=uncultured Trichococcus sp. TaxID=189665 RepID=UPI002A189ACB|nr:Flp family type IVb pilin [uncultured Trichococcus sp.]
MEIMKRLVREEEGQGIVEYALVLGVISIAAIAFGPNLVEAIKAAYNDVIAELGGVAIPD